MMVRSIGALVFALALGSAPWACASARPLGPSTAIPSAGALAEVPGDPPSSGGERASTSIVDAGLKPPPDAKQLPEGGSLRPQDSALLPESAGLPDTFTPPMVRDASIPEARPVPLSR